MRSAAFGLSLLLVTGCPYGTIAPYGGPFCTAIYGYGLNVTVTDVNGITVPGATLTLTDGAHTETMEEHAAGIYAGAGERAGTYTLRVEADGFVTQTITDIVIDADECHVIPVARDVELTAG